MDKMYNRQENIRQDNIRQNLLMDNMYNRQDNIRQFLLKHKMHNRQKWETGILSDKKALDKYLFKKTALTKFRKDRQETF